MDVSLTGQLWIFNVGIFQKSKISIFLANSPSQPGCHRSDFYYCETLQLALGGFPEW